MDALEQQDTVGSDTRLLIKEGEVGHGAKDQTEVIVSPHIRNIIGFNKVGTRGGKEATQGSSIREGVPSNKGVTEGNAQEVVIPRMPSFEESKGNITISINNNNEKVWKKEGKKNTRTLTECNG